MHYIIKKSKAGTVAVYNGKQVPANNVRNLVRQDVQNLVKQMKYN